MPITSSRPLTTIKLVKYSMSKMVPSFLR